MRDLHADWYIVAVIASGVVGLWGLVAAIIKRGPGKWFAVATWIAIGTMLVQVTLGLLAYNDGFRPSGDFHIFYGFVILFTFAFAYIYRAQLAKRPALAYGLLLLFVMGLGLRAVANT